MRRNGEAANVPSPQGQRRIVPGRKGTGGVCLSREVSPSEGPPFHISSLGAKRNQLTLQLEPINPRKSATPSAVAVFNKRQKRNKSINKKGKRHGPYQAGSRFFSDSRSIWGCKTESKVPQNGDFSTLGMLGGGMDPV